MDENRKDREKLEQLKKQYEQINMSERQVEQMDRWTRSHQRQGLSSA